MSFASGAAVSASVVLVGGLSFYGCDLCSLSFMMVILPHPSIDVSFLRFPPCRRDRLRT